MLLGSGSGSGPDGVAVHGPLDALRLLGVIIGARVLPLELLPLKPLILLLLLAVDELTLEADLLSADLSADLVLLLLPLLQLDDEGVQDELDGGVADACGDEIPVTVVLEFTTADVNRESASKR